MYEHTVTVFNFHEKTNAWYPSAFTGVSLYATEAASAAREAAKVNATEIDVIIHVDRNQAANTMIYESNRVVGSGGNAILAADGGMLSYMDPETNRVKKYTGPMAFSKLDDPRSWFTFCPEQDFILVGAWLDTEPIPDDAYESGFYDAMNETNDGVYKITSAAFYGLLPHFEIGGQ